MSRSYHKSTDWFNKTRYRFEFKENLLDNNRQWKSEYWSKEQKKEFKRMLSIPVKMPYYTVSELKLMRRKDRRFNNNPKNW